MERRSTLLALCERNPPVTDDQWIPQNGPVMWGFDVFLIVSLKKPLNEQFLLISHPSDLSVMIFPGSRCLCERALHGWCPMVSPEQSHRGIISQTAVWHHADCILHRKFIWCLSVWFVFSQILSKLQPILSKAFLFSFEQQMVPLCSVVSNV